MILQGSSFSRSGKRRPWSIFWVIENRVVSYTPLCLKVVIEPFRSDFKGGSSFSRHLNLQINLAPCPCKDIGTPRLEERVGGSCEEGRNLQVQPKAKL